MNSCCTSTMKKMILNLLQTAKEREEEKAREESDIILDPCCKKCAKPFAFLVSKREAEACACDIQVFTETNYDYDFNHRGHNKRNRSSKSAVSRKIVCVEKESDAFAYKKTKDGNLKYKKVFVKKMYIRCA